jgi:leucyl/phenylalanyl-tRNA--protein transferase
MFFGESMFSRANDASKIAFVHLIAFLKRQGVSWIDCQMQTEHLASLGAQVVNREQFLQHVRNQVQAPELTWHPGWLDQQGILHPILPAVV